MIPRLAALAAVHALQRIESRLIRVAGTDGRSVVAIGCPWSLARDAMGTGRQRLIYDAPDFYYPDRVLRVDRVGPVVLVYNCAEEERGSVFVFLASREVTDGSLARRWIARHGGDVMDMVTP